MEKQEIKSIIETILSKYGDSIEDGDYEDVAELIVDGLVEKGVIKAGE